MQGPDDGRDKPLPARDPRWSRRGLILGAGASGLLAACSPAGGGAGGGRTLRVSAYGGNFERAMSAHIYPLFEQKTGIKVVSQAQPAGVQFLLQLIEANKAGMPPMDVCIAASEDVLRGRQANVWKIRDLKTVPNAGNLPDQYIARGPNGVDGIGAVGWFLVMVMNPKLVHPVPDSWTALWQPGFKDAWGLSGGGGSGMFEITAGTYFGGTQILETEDGIRKVVAKMAELKPNTKLWWDSEGTMQTALENGEVKGGTYFRDVAKTMADSGVSVQAVFPKEGALIDYGCWCQPSASKKTAEAEAFIDFMCTAEAQNLLASKVNVPPLIRKELLTLSPETAALVTSPNEPIATNLAARSKHLDFMVQQFNQMAAS
ncbi:ABC transporter substrate-binding protein [Caulobacter sp. KR2-114]|uniref:ABC transporter substrate-binding protein n=1 Tax=Caulobacter sp. KR2-114 TaxID=3400912 RepID=UPI003C03800B